MNILRELRFRWTLWRMNRYARRFGTTVEEMGIAARVAGDQIRDFMVQWQRAHR